MIIKLLICSLPIWMQSQAVYTAKSIQLENCGKLEKVNQNENPWLAAVVAKDGDKYFCGGTIINEKVILTAAHCLRGFNQSDLYILAGTSELEDSPQRFEIKSFFAHPKFANPHIRNDIGLILIDGTFEWSSKLLPICLPENNTSSAGRTCQVAEWIPVNANANGREFHARGSEVSIISLVDCKNTYEPLVNISGGMFCANKPTNKDFRKSSGSPLICQDNGHFVLNGITSTKLREKESPVIYTNVFRYLSFIGHNIKAPDQDVIYKRIFLNDKK